MFKRREGTLSEAQSPPSIGLSLSKALDGQRTRRVGTLRHRSEHEYRLVLKRAPDTSGRVFILLADARGSETIAGPLPGTTLLRDAVRSLQETLNAGSNQQVRITLDEEEVP